MGDLNKLERRVKGLYEAHDPGQDKWAGWLYRHHVLVVADNAEALAKRFGADPELSRAVALLHDVADANMKRSNPGHEAQSLKMAREELAACGYGAEDIAMMVDDALALHSCHGDDRPASEVGKVLATADALAHLRTDFYLQAILFKAGEWTLAEIKPWVLKKIERDYHKKILFEPVRAETAEDYRLIKQIFSR